MSMGTLILSEICLARRATMELIRDASPEARERLSASFVLEAIAAISASQLDINAACARLCQTGEEVMAQLILDASAVTRVAEVNG